MNELHILGGARTPMAEYNGQFRTLAETDLGALAIKAALEKTGVSPRAIDHVVMGNALQTSRNAAYGARHAALKAGIPIEVPALTVNRLCGSGIQSIISASHMIRLEEADKVAAGGMENMSQAPHVIRGLRTGLRLGEGALEDSLVASLMDDFCGLMMSGTAEEVGKAHGVTRTDADAFALRSQHAAEAAYRAGKFADEIAPVEVKERKGLRVVKEDDHRRPETTLEGLAGLPAAFAKGELVTAGNASGIVDGAACLIVSRTAPAAGAPPALGRIVGWATAGVEPRLMGIGPVPAIRRALETTGLKLGEIALFEINEAFSAQYVAVERVLGLDRERVNVNGGAVALGHPLGATGTRLVLTLLLELRRRGGGYGIASACIGGGQGIALVVEAPQSSRNR